MSNATALNKSTFAAAIASPTPTLIDFWAPWCPPCRAMGPVIDDLAKELAGQANVAKVDVEEEQDLAAQYNITSIPAFIVFKNGQEVARMIGAKPKEELKKKILG